MTREEALWHLDTYSSTLGSGQTTQEQHEEAKRIAIEALENAEQIRWERDTAIQQLKDLGYGLGEKPRTDGDCIRRQDFDKFLEDGEKEAVKNRKYVFASALNAIRGNLRNFPSVQPDRKCGKWERWTDKVEHSRGVEYIPRCRCSECGTEYDPNSAKFINFCPQCGADMRGEQDDSV